ncbi:MAG TPA: cation transporter [Gammaproteobacteria bacterium]|nr:cation transporter [Gammaproteobacteria bacterium]
MHSEEFHPWQHTHTFGQDRRRPGERRTLIVIALTGAMMVVEIFAGMAFGSMALLADGLHMASHVVALGVSALAYVYARRHAHDSTFSFGTGKVNTLGGFTGAVLLAVFAALMGWESLARFVQPTAIVFDQAILVAILGLVVNGISALILGMGQLPEDGDHAHGHEHGHAHQHHDHNLESAYLHVLADAATSVLAIIALLAGKYLGLLWMDPAMGIVGAILVARWAFGLLRTTSSILLDRQGPETLSRSIRQGIELDHDSQITDLHLWSIGPDLYAVILTIVAQEPRSPGEYRARIAQHPQLAHISLEIHRRPVTLAAGVVGLAQPDHPA